jgi:hypothetical protein
MQKKIEFIPPFGIMICLLCFKTFSIQKIGISILKFLFIIFSTQKIAKKYEDNILQLPQKTFTMYFLNVLMIVWLYIDDVFIFQNVKKMNFTCNFFFKDKRGWHVSKKFRSEFH